MTKACVHIYEQAGICVYTCIIHYDGKIDPEGQAVDSNYLYGSYTQSKTHSLQC